MPIDPVSLLATHRSAFDLYRQLLLKWNDKFNLTSITEPAEIDEFHFIDSLMALQVIVPRETNSPNPPLKKGGEGGISILDIGAGAGFPGIPLKIAHPSLQVCLVDSTKKKCDFMKEVIRRLGLDGISVLHQRVAAEGGVTSRLFDVVISRAALHLKELLNIAAPNLQGGGTLIAMKGVEIEQEVKEAGESAKKYGFGTFELVPYQLALSGKKRLLVTAQKI